MQSCRMSKRACVWNPGPENMLKEVAQGWLTSSWNSPCPMLWQTSPTFFPEKLKWPPWNQARKHVAKPSVLRGFSTCGEIWPGGLGQEHEPDRGGGWQEGYEDRLKSEKRDPPHKSCTTNDTLEAWNLSTTGFQNQALSIPLSYMPFCGVRHIETSVPGDFFNVSELQGNARTYAGT